jgi:hypothetical protein
MTKGVVVAAEVGWMDGWGGCGCCALLLSLSAFLLGSLGLPSLSLGLHFSLSNDKSKRKENTGGVPEKKFKFCSGNKGCISPKN